MSVGRKILITAFGVALVAAVAGSDPYKSLGQGAVGLATFGIVALQMLAAVAIVAFFRRRGQGRYWRTLVLPGVGAVGLFSATVFLLLNFSTLVGTSSPLVTALPWLLLSVVAAGVVGWLTLLQPAPDTPTIARGDTPI